MTAEAARPPESHEDPVVARLDTLIDINKQIRDRLPEPAKKKTPSSRSRADVDGR